MKNLLAIALGVVVVGIAVWRLTHGETVGGLVLIAVGVFLLFRGLTGSVRPGL